MPQQLGKYLLHEELGRGGFAVVHRAVHETLQTEIALKILSPSLSQDPDARERFFREAQTASQLDHPNIVRILDLDRDGETWFIASEYMPGGDLKTWLAENDPPGHTQVLSWLAEVADALDYAHRQDVLHRDVKPGNILLDAEGQARLCDFGLVLVANTPRLTQLGRVVGSASYISPEQAEAKTVDGRADQYSLAVVAYEMLVGQLPFMGEDSTAIALMHVTKAPPDPGELNPGIPAEVARVLLRALEKGPEERYETCSAFIRELENAYEISRLRLFRENLAEVRARIDAGEPGEARKLFNELQGVLAQRAENLEQLAELEPRLVQAEHYRAGCLAWSEGLQMGRAVLDRFPEFPDDQGIFVPLELRPAERSRRSGREWAQLIGAGLLVGLPPAIWLFLKLIDWIEGFS